MLAGTLLVAALLVSLFLGGLSSAAGEKKILAEEQALFVAPDGNDENPGSRREPWRTLQHAAERVQPGETVYIRGGVYEEPVRIEKSGVPGEYITFENYPGERPVIDPGFKAGSGIQVVGSYVKIKGFEIRNCKPDLELRGDAGALAFYGAHHCIAEGNTVHHIIGAQEETRGKPAIGIYLQDADAITVQDNTVYEIVGHCESMGIKADTVSNVIIRGNLVYFCDKEGIRLLTYDLDSEIIIEANIAISNNMGIAVNNCRPENGSIIVRNNFCSWNSNLGTQPKHTTNTLVTHNTFYENQGKGLMMNDRPFNYYPVVKNNLLSNNQSAWRINDNETFHETVDYNFYQYRPGRVLAAFNWADADRCYSVSDIREKTECSDTMNGIYERHGKEGDPRFVDPAGGDFRLQADSPARGAADDGTDMGALEGELAEVGAGRNYGLGNIPDLGELRLRVESFSSESPEGRAAHATDHWRDSYWEIDATADTKREIVLRLPGDDVYELTYITLGKAASRDHYYRQFRIYAEDGVWKLVPESAEHPFVGFTSPQGINNGETWSLPNGTLARKLKVELVSGYGDIIRIPEIRLYGSRAGQLP